MRDDQLIAFLVARGVDFEHVAGSSSDTKGDARPRRMSNAERKQANKDGRAPVVTETVTGHQTRVYRTPGWSHQELAMAARGMKITPWLAISFSVAHDSTAHPHLIRHLRREAAHLAIRESWPDDVSDVHGITLFYVEPLIQLLLCEEEHKGRFEQAQPAPVHAWLMDVTERTWDHNLRPKYTHLQQTYEGWLCEGRALARRRIMGGDCADQPMTETVFGSVAQVSEDSCT